MAANSIFANSVRALVAIAAKGMLNVQCTSPIRLTSPIVIITPTPAIAPARLQTIPTPTIASKATATPTSPSTVTSVASSAPSQSPGSGTIDFPGYSWIIKSTSTKAEPGPNLWSPSRENVSVDGSGRLHLRVTKRNDTWYSAEIFTTQSFGYGIYRFYIDSDVANLDPNVAAGFFTWSDDPGYNHRELDI